MTVMFCLLYKHQSNTTTFHFNIFCTPNLEQWRDSLCNNDSNVVFFTWRYSVSCYFQMWRCQYHVFMQKLTWYFNGVYLIKQISSLYNHNKFTYNELMWPNVHVSAAYFIVSYWKNFFFARASQPLRMTKCLRHLPNLNHVLKMFS